MQFRLSEAEKQKVKRNYARLYAQGLRDSPEPKRWEFIAIEIGLLLVPVSRAIRRFLGYHIDLY